MVARLAAFFGLLKASAGGHWTLRTLSYAMSRRTAEVGIRMALRAKRTEVLWMVLRQSVLVSLAGVTMGLPFSDRWCAIHAIDAVRE
jgi:hypothetical protein